MPSGSPARLIHSYGRRRGRPLRHGRAAALSELLPRLAIAAPEPGQMLHLAGLFGHAPTQVWLEIGFGGGEHLAAQAEAHRDVGLIGAEPYINGIAGLLARVAEAKLDNIRLWPGDIRELLPAFPSGSLSRVFILFPDPWPKARHHKRRLIQRPFLDEIARLLVPGGELRFATDDPDYFTWSLERLTAHLAFAWQANGPADWRERPADWPPTRYEAKAIAAGRRPAYLSFTRRERSETGGETP